MHLYTFALASIAGPFAAKIGLSCILILEALEILKSAYLGSSSLAVKRPNIPAIIRRLLQEIGHRLLRRGGHDRDRYLLIHDALCLPVSVRAALYLD